MRPKGAAQKVGKRYDKVAKQGLEEHERVLFVLGFEGVVIRMAGRRCAMATLRAIS